MGMAALYEQVPLGVWMLRETGELVLITERCSFVDCNILYKKRQRKPKRIMQHALLLYFDYLGEL